MRRPAGLVAQLTAPQSGDPLETEELTLVGKVLVPGSKVPPIGFRPAGSKRFEPVATRAVEGGVEFEIPARRGVLKEALIGIAEGGRWRPVLRLHPYPADLDELVSACWSALGSGDFRAALTALRDALEGDWSLLGFATPPRFINEWAVNSDVKARFRVDAIQRTKDESHGAALRDFNLTCLSERACYLYGPYSGERLSAICSFTTENFGRHLIHFFIDEGKPVFSIQELWAHGYLYMPADGIATLMNDAHFRNPKEIVKEILVIFLRSALEVDGFFTPDKDRLTVINVENAPYHFLYDHFYGSFLTLTGYKEPITYACLENGDYLGVPELLGLNAVTRHWPNLRAMAPDLREAGGMILSFVQRLDQDADPDGYLRFVSAICDGDLPVHPEFAPQLEAMTATDGLLWFGVSAPGQKRTWVNQVECVTAMIRAGEEAAREKGLRLGVVIDGWTNPVSLRTRSLPEIAADRGVFNEIVERLEGRADIWSLIGWSGPEKLSAARLTRFAVTNAGTGAAFVSKLARRPTLLRDNAQMLEANSKTWDSATATRLDEDAIETLVPPYRTRLDKIDFRIDEDRLVAQYRELLRQAL